ncbi:MAG TPA: LuxR C-terminal-related transcriptional regulator [Rubrivivax sp.]|nr:LuxR C-terminal-related transcriptional regulator [Rubrivivax sp.]HPO20310.1 LuxR C-terminal-related transcriptional regulator [Rubrivivax sp.]
MPETSRAQALNTALDGFSALLSGIYDAALDPALWAHCLTAICRELRANYVSLIVRPGSADDLGLIVSATSEPRELDPHNRFISMSPFAGLQPDRLVTITDILSETDWRNSQYFRDWCKPHDVFHVMACDIATQGGIYGFRLTRPEHEPAFGAAERAQCARLLPHLRRALSLHQAQRSDRRVHSLYSQAMAQLMVGAIVLDERGKVLECNPMANAIVKMADGLRIADDEVEATYRTDNTRLQRLIRDAMASLPGRTPSLIEAMSVTRPSGKVAWGVVVQPIAPDDWSEGKHRPSVAVFVRDAEGKADPPVRLAQQLFQLTPAETALAIQLANGLSLEEAAEALNIRRNTARAHLRSIFSKTGVRRQTELVRIFLNSVALLGGSG